MLANKGHDTRCLQKYLGHKNIQHTVRYTELSPDRFKASGVSKQANDGELIGYATDIRMGAEIKAGELLVGLRDRG
jgi:type 1 fimbriae regulatory protein FimB/type 1 fimbriae regulatory protein FimE